MPSPTYLGGRGFVNVDIVLNVLFVYSTCLAFQGGSGRSNCILIYSTFMKVRIGTSSDCDIALIKAKNLFLLPSLELDLMLISE